MTTTAQLAEQIGDIAEELMRDELPHVGNVVIRRVADLLEQQTRKVLTPTVEVERGAKYVTFDGGPMDGGHSHIQHADRDLHGAILSLHGHDYDVTAVEHTCYRASLIPGSQNTSDSEDEEQGR